MAGEVPFELPQEDVPDDLEVLFRPLRDDRQRADTGVAHGDETAPRPFGKVILHLALDPGQWPVEAELSVRGDAQDPAFRGLWSTVGPCPAERVAATVS